MQASNKICILWNCRHTGLKGKGYGVAIIMDHEIGKHVYGHNEYSGYGVALKPSFKGNHKIKLIGPETRQIRKTAKNYKNGSKKKSMMLIIETCERSSEVI